MHYTLVRKLSDANSARVLGTTCTCVKMLVMQIRNFQQLECIQNEALIYKMHGQQGSSTSAIASSSAPVTPLIPPAAISTAAIAATTAPIPAVISAAASPPAVPGRICISLYALDDAHLHMHQPGKHTERMGQQGPGALRGKCRCKVNDRRNMLLLLLL